MRGLFRRGPAADAPDEALPFLTLHEAGEVRRLAAAAFARAGREVVIHDDHLEGADGWQYGLWNVAAACKAAGHRRRWAGVVTEHVAALLEAPPSIADLPVEEVLAHAVLRVYGTELLAPETLAEATYVSELAEGLVEALVFDSPRSVVMLLDEEVERCGAAALRAAGLEHLVAEPFGSVESLDVGQGVTVEVIEGDSVFTASKVLVLPDVLRRVYGDRAFPHGVLVAVPDRHHLVLHPITGPQVLPSLQATASMAASHYASAVGGVSPSVYWWNAGRLERLSSIGEDSRLRIDVHEDFGRVLNELVGEG